MATQPPLPELSELGYVGLGRIAFMDTLRPYFSPDEMEQIEAAYAFSKFGHGKQMREDGSRYFEHPKTVAWILGVHCSFHDWELLAIALLHDILEDSFILSYDRIEINSGRNVAHGVKYLSKNDFSPDTPDSEYYERLSQFGEWREQAAKLADRLHNLRTIKTMKPERQLKKLKETKEYFPAIEQALLEQVPDKHHGSAELLCRELHSAIAWLEAELAKN